MFLLPLQAQLFSDRVQGAIDWSKVTKEQYFRTELSHNPEFFKAFPHLKHLEDGKDGSLAQVQPQSVPFFESLLHQHVKLLTPTAEEEVRENEERFVSAFHTKEGPLKYLSIEEREHVHE